MSHCEFSFETANPQEQLTMKGGEIPYNVETDKMGIPFGENLPMVPHDFKGPIPCPSPVLPDKLAG
jgi:hypothetical protein